MTFRSIHAPMSVSRALQAISISLALAACGGGTGYDSTGVASASPDPQVLSAAGVQATAAPVSVTVEGCVFDRNYIPTTGTRVRALAADGRLLGNAQSDGQGRFTLRLPVHSDVTLQVDRPSGESLLMHVDAAATTWETCLVDDQA